MFFAALLAVGAGAAGCDLGGSPSGASQPSASASMSRQQILALGQEWVQCIRDHGFRRMPDAQLTPEGYLQFPPQSGYNWKADLVKHPGILDACKSIEARYPPSARRPRSQVSAADLRKLGEYAKCIRAHGVPEFPDPNAAGEFDLSGTSLANGGLRQQMRAAEQACKHIWSGEIRVNDGGGGKK
jgi:hypothetical protein